MKIRVHAPRTVAGTPTLWIVLFLFVTGVQARAQEPAVDEAQAAAATSGEAPSEPTTPNLDQFRAKLGRLDELSGQIEDVVQGKVKAGDQDARALMRVTAIKQFEESRDLLKDLSVLFPKIEADSTLADSLGRVAGDYCRRQLRFEFLASQVLYPNVERMWSQRADLPASEMADFESRIHEELVLADRTVDWMLATSKPAKMFGVDTDSVWIEVDPLLIKGADGMAGRISVAVQERNRIQAQISLGTKSGSGEQEISDLRIRLQAVDLRLNTNVEAMRRRIRHLEARGIEASVYRQAVIEATGEIGVGVLDPQVLGALLSAAWSSFVNWITEDGPTLIVRLLIVLAFVLLFRFSARLIWMLILVTRVQKKSRLLRDMMGRMLVPVATMLGLFSGLWFLGVNPGTLLAGVGVASVILGLALQDSLGNLAAGAFILLYRPYDVDDTVHAGGVVGLVKAMGLANTTIVTFDNRRLFVPNRKIWSEVIENRTMEDRRRVETVIRVRYGHDIDSVIALVRKELADQKIVLNEPEPTIFVSNLADSWVEISIWPWASLENWWALYTGLPHMMLRLMEREKIPVAWRQQEVMLNDDRSPGPRDR